MGGQPSLLLVQYEAYRKYAIQVGVAAAVHLAELLKSSEDVPSPVLVLGISSDLMKHKQGLYSLWPQQIVGVLPKAYPVSHWVRCGQQQQKQRQQQWQQQQQQPQRQQQQRQQQKQQQQRQRQQQKQWQQKQQRQQQ